MAHRLECVGIVAVENQPRDFVAFIRHHGFIEEGAQWQIGQRHLRRNALFGIQRRHTGELVARAQRAGLGQQRAQVRKLVTLLADGWRVGMALECTDADSVVLAFAPVALAFAFDGVLVRAAVAFHAVVKLANTSSMCSRRIFSVVCSCSHNRCSGCSHCAHGRSHKWWCGRGPAQSICCAQGGGCPFLLVWHWAQLPVICLCSASVGDLWQLWHWLLVSCLSRAWSK